MVRTFAKQKHETTERKVYVDDPCCKANGCPLPSSFVTETFGADAGDRRGAPKGGVCGHHFAAKPNQWSEVTKRIRRLYPVIHLLYQIGEKTSVEQSMMIPEEVPGFSDIDPETGETMFQWERRAWDWVDHEIRKDLPDPELKAKTTRSSLTEMMKSALNATTRIRGGDALDEHGRYV